MSLASAGTSSQSEWGEITSEIDPKPKKSEKSSIKGEPMKDSKLPGNYNVPISQALLVCWFRMVTVINWDTGFMWFQV